MDRWIEKYYGGDVEEVRRLLLGIRDRLRVAQAKMTPEQFKRHLYGIELDEGAAADWLLSDGSIESITNRMLPYLLPPEMKALSA